MQIPLAADGSSAGYFIPIGLIIWIAWWLIKKAAGANSSEPSQQSVVGSQPRPGTDSLIARVRWVERSEHIASGHYLVEVKGKQQLVAGQSARFQNFLRDTTDPSAPLPVIALLDWQQAEDSIAFLDTTELGMSEVGEYLNFPDWKSINLPIFPEMTKAPYSGQRRLTASLRLVTSRGGTLWSKDVEFGADLSVAGFIEDRDREQADDGLIVRMAVAVAAASGEVSDDELAVIHRWSQDRLSYLDAKDEERASRATALNQALARSIRDADLDALDLGATIKRFLVEGSEGGRIEAIELCLGVMRADGVADHNEMIVINRLAKQFEIDPAWFADKRDKSVSGLTTQTTTAADYATLLGIDPKASKDTIRQQLNEQYDRWSSRAVSLADPDQRRAAEQMLETIARARAELIN